MKSYDKAPSLFRTYRDAFRIGAAITPAMIRDPDSSALIRRHFNSITAENIMKPELLLDHEATLALGDEIRTVQRFGAADAMLSFARDNGIGVRFHTLVWHNQTPRWFFAEKWSDAPDAPLVGPELMLRRLEAYIRDVMTHVNVTFPGVVYCWDVVNEAIEPDQGAPGCYRTKSPWHWITGKEFIPAAFRAARRYQAPGQKLFYNDYNCFQETKLAAILDLLKELRAEDLVDGMGMQGHFVLDNLSVQECEKAARAYAALGLTLQTTELDIHCPGQDAASQERLADLYGDYFDMLLRLREDGIPYECATFWGLTDRDTWLTHFRREGSYPLLFTGEKETKPAFDAVLNAPDRRSCFRVNQTGYAVGLPKPFVLRQRGSVTLEDEGGRILRLFGDPKLTADAAAGENAALLDAGDLPAGDYTLRCGGICTTFSVSAEPWKAVADALVKGFYFQRCGLELKEKYAGRYTHAACHTAPAREWDNPETEKHAAGGWHDAGDYGKYVGPGAVAAAHLMYTWKLFPNGCSEILNIPESGNGTPDILNEVRWELEWILKMQRTDGAFYHKLTKARFAPFIMPEEDREQEYLMPVSSCATAAACACCALAAGIWRERDADFADRLTGAALNAWAWLEAHPEITPFTNPEGVRTGQYGDQSDRDERFWAACELYALTGENLYRQAAEEEAAGLEHWTRFGWADVTGLGALCCLFTLGVRAGSALYGKIKEAFLAQCEDALKRVRSSAYGTALNPEEYIWGSTMLLMNGAMAMICSWLLTGRIDMRDGALLQLHYALGLNPLSRSLITGFGKRRVMNPHHRPSGADGIEEPVPGLISGGPNARWNYEETRRILTEDTPPAKFFLDETPSADTNEIAVYWNSITVFVFACFNQLTRQGTQE